jgi:hypothetical protein
MVQCLSNKWKNFTLRWYIQDNTCKRSDLLRAHSLFNDAISMSDYVASTDRVSQKRIEVDAIGNGRGLI